MNFEDVIESIISKVEGAVAVLIVGVDGIIIDKAVKVDEVSFELNLELLAAEYTSLLKTALRTADDVEIGALREFSVFTEKYHFVINMISNEYYLMMVIEPDGNFGRARYELKKAKFLLEEEFHI